jgi:hypothetical protein
VSSRRQSDAELPIKPAAAAAGRPASYAPAVDIDASSLLAGLLVSSVGFVLFSYGRKMSRPPHVISGLLLLIFPYFVGNVLAMFAIAAVICLAVYGAVRAGY